MKVENGLEMGPENHLVLREQFEKINEGRSTAQCVSGISNDLALQYENQFVQRNRHVWAYSM